MSGGAPFDALAVEMPDVAPLAALHAVVARSAAAPFWAEGLPGFPPGMVTDGGPLLDGRIIRLDAGRVRSLLMELAAVAARGGVDGSERLLRRLKSRDVEEGADALSLLRASICGDEAHLATVAAAWNVETALLETLVHLAALPVLRAAGAAAAPRLAGGIREEGACPLCAAWPLLAESRGLERERWLCCGRCATAWQVANQRCIFCGNRDHQTLGYLAAAEQRESRIAVTCAHCLGYLKSVTVISPLSADDLALRDMTTLDLDLAAMERGYQRPARLARRIEVQVEPIQRPFGWLPWER